MKYFPTIYNEKNKIMNSYNSWEYYFNNFNNSNIDDIYKYYNYKFSDEKSFDTSKIKKFITKNIKEFY